MQLKTRLARIAGILGAFAALAASLGASLKWNG
jgi:hypothetical protein